MHGSGHTYYHEFIGGMFRLSALQAAVLDIKLRHLESWHEGRRNARGYLQQGLRRQQGDRSVHRAGQLERLQPVLRGGGEPRPVKSQAGRARQWAAAIYYPLSLHEQKCFAYLGYKAGRLPRERGRLQEDPGLCRCTRN